MKSPKRWSIYLRTLQRSWICYQIISTGKVAGRLSSFSTWNVPSWFILTHRDGWNPINRQYKFIWPRLPFGSSWAIEIEFASLQWQDQLIFGHVTSDKCKIRWPRKCFSNDTAVSDHMSTFRAVLPRKIFICVADAKVTLFCAMLFSFSWFAFSIIYSKIHGLMRVCLCAFADVVWTSDILHVVLVAWGDRRIALVVSTD